MRQHCALGYSGRATGVLQEGNVLRTHVDGIEWKLASGLDRLAKVHCAWDMPLRHLLAAMPHDVVDDPGFREAEEVSRRGYQHFLQARVRGHLLHNVGEVLQHHDGRRAGVLELVLQLPRGVKGVGVDDNQAAPQRTE